jgi:hypothetical protein
MKFIIDYEKITNAIDFYTYHGFQYIQAPWHASEKAIRKTMPEGKRITKINTYPVNLVGSGEQVFIDLMMNKQLTFGRYICVTPCFRDDKIDELHGPYFLKAEWISINPISPEMELVWCLMKSFDFFEQYLECREEKKENNSYDIVSQNKGIELGSYGIQNDEEVGTWVYGTAIAEPRLSLAMRMENEDD